MPYKSPAASWALRHSLAVVCCSVRHPALDACRRRTASFPSSLSSPIFWRGAGLSAPCLEGSQRLVCGLWWCSLSFSLPLSLFFSLFLPACFPELRQHPGGSRIPSTTQLLSRGVSSAPPEGASTAALQPDCSGLVLFSEQDSEVRLHSWGRPG